MSLKKEMKELVSAAKTAGFTVTHTNGGHLRFSMPGSQPIFGASTPSDQRAVLNLRAMLYRNGLPKAS